MIMCMTNNFSLELSYSEDKVSKSHFTKNSNTLENNKEYYSQEDDNSVEDFNFVTVGDFSCNEDAKKNCYEYIKCRS
jgi:hypothetical protein